MILHPLHSQANSINFFSSQIIMDISLENGEEMRADEQSCVALTRNVVNKFEFFAVLILFYPCCSQILAQ